LLWNLERVLRVAPLLDTIDDPVLRGLSTSFLQHFESRVVPALAGLRRQVIHNDLNPYNALVDEDDACRLTGIIDFGDMLAAPLVQEVSTAAAYQIQPEGCPMAGPADVLRGYHRVLPLSDAELALVPDLITARLVLTIAITSWRAAQHPDNAPYILRNRRMSDMGLLRLHEFSRDENVARLLDALDDHQTGLPS
jgi:Ser/Thr protein kinase RdoA (MazF antagonist)